MKSRIGEAGARQEERMLARDVIEEPAQRRKTVAPGVSRGCGAIKYLSPKGRQISDVVLRVVPRSLSFAR